MNLDHHERAKRLMAAAAIEGIPAGERRWLDAHLAHCSECSDGANVLAFSIESLRRLRVNVPAGTVRRTSLAVHRRAEELHDRREKALPLWIAVATSGIWAVLTAPYAWSAFGWLGRVFQVSDSIWHLGFLMWWFLPATVLSAFAGWHITGRKAASNWITESDWR